MPNLNEKLLQAMAKMDPNKLNQLQKMLMSSLSEKDIEGLKKKLSGVNQEKLAQLLSTADSKKLNDIISSLKGNTNINIDDVLKKL